MLTVTEVVEKIFKQPNRFEQEMAAGNYCKAKWTYINTMFVAGFIEMDREALDRLLEMFNEQKVKKAFRKAGGPDDTGCRPKKKADPAG